MRVLVFFVLSVVVHFLAARWVLSVSAWARSRRRLVFAVAFGLSCTLAALRILGLRHQGPVVQTLLAVGTVELAVVAIALLPFGLVALSARATARAIDAVRPPASDDAGASRVSRREAIELGIGVSIAGATTTALGWGVARGRHAFALEEVVVAVPGWPRSLEGYVIAQVSDVHVGPFVGDRELDEGFEVVRRARPDLVVATGDLVDAEAHMIGPLIARMLAVGARDGAYAILGNHDHYAGAADVAGRIAGSKVKLLANESVRVRREDGGGFALVGVDDIQGRYGKSPAHRGPDLTRAVSGLPPEVPRILLAHQPRFFDESKGRVALQLSGHTHGGQINPGFRPAGMFMEFLAGRYTRAGSTLWVNRGFGVVGPPARIGAPPEVTKIVIVAA